MRRFTKVDHTDLALVLGYETMTISIRHN